MDVKPLVGKDGTNGLRAIYLGDGRPYLYWAFQAPSLSSCEYDFQLNETVLNFNGSMQFAGFTLDGTLASTSDTLHTGLGMYDAAGYFSRWHQPGDSAIRGAHTNSIGVFYTINNGNIAWDSIRHDLLSNGKTAIGAALMVKPAGEKTSTQTYDTAPVAYQAVSFQLGLRGGPGAGPIMSTFHYDNVRFR